MYAAPISPASEVGTSPPPTPPPTQRRVPELIDEVVMPVTFSIAPAQRGLQGGRDDGRPRARWSYGAGIADATLPSGMSRSLTAAPDWRPSAPTPRLPPPPERVRRYNENTGTERYENESLKELFRFTVAEDAHPPDIIENLGLDVLCFRWPAYCPPAGWGECVQACRKSSRESYFTSDDDPAYSVIQTHASAYDMLYLWQGRVHSWLRRLDAEELSEDQDHEPFPEFPPRETWAAVANDGGDVPADTAEDSPLSSFEPQETVCVSGGVVCRHRHSSCIHCC